MVVVDARDVSLPRPRRIWFRFSVRALLALMLLIAVFLAGYRWGYEDGRDDRFHELIELITNTIAPSTWDEELAQPPPNPFGPTPRDDGDPFQ